MTLTQVTTEGIKDGTITGSDLATNVDLVDNQKIRLGTSQDLEIYHDGTHSYISEIGTGELRITTDSAVHIRKHNNENIAKFTANGSVELHHDNTKRFETDSNGCTLTGTLTTTSGINAGNNISMNDNIKVKFGNNDDLQIFHDGTHSTIQNLTGDLTLQNDGDDVQLLANDDIKMFVQGGAETAILAKGNGEVALYFNGNKKFETLTDGVNVTGTLKVNGSAFTGGKILQVVQGTRTSQFSSTSTSYVDLGLSASITPSTNSKILAVVNIQSYLQSDNNEGFGIRLKRTPSGGSAATVFTSASKSDVRGFTNFTGEHIRMYVRSSWDIFDSSVGGNGSTAITYKVQVANVSSSSITYSKNGNLSSITLLEVAA